MLKNQHNLTPSPPSHNSALSQVGSLLLDNHTDKITYHIICFSIHTFSSKFLFCQYYCILNFRIILQVWKKRTIFILYFDFLFLIKSVLAFISKSFFFLYPRIKQHYHFSKIFVRIIFSCFFFSTLKFLPNLNSKNHFSLVKYLCRNCCLTP